MATLTIQLPDDVCESVRAAAAAAGCSVDDLLTTLIVNALDPTLDDPIDPELHAQLAQQLEDLAAGRLETRPASEIVAELLRRHEC